MSVKILHKLVCLLLVCLFLISLSSKTLGQNRIACVIPSAEEETDYVWRTLRDISFFEQHNYTVNLPKGALIDTLCAKSKRKQLSDEDFEALGAYMKKVIYREQDYQKGYQKVMDQLGLLHRMLGKLGKQTYSWDFKEFDTYTVKLTLYGSGGSYDPEEGSIILFTTPTGEFKQYENPANTIIHEIVHIATEAAIIQSYQLNHGLKERIIDRFVFTYFGKNLPTYRIQNMGDKRIDAFLQKKKDFRKLDQAVEAYLK